MKLVGLFRKVLEENDGIEGYYGFVNSDFDDENINGYFLKYQSGEFALCYTMDENIDKIYYFIYTEAIPNDYYVDYFEGYMDYDDDGSRYKSYDASNNTELDKSGILLYLKHKLLENDYTENFQSFEEDGDYDTIKITPENEKLLFKSHKKFFLGASGHLN